MRQLSSPLVQVVHCTAAVAVMSGTLADGELEFIREIEQLMNTKGGLNHTHVTRAIQNRHYQALERLIEYMPVEELVLDQAFDPLCQAAMVEDCGRALGMLLPHLADKQLLSSCRKSGSTALHCAETPEAIAMLVKRLDDEGVMVRDREGKTPLDVAIASQGARDLSLIAALSPRQLLIPQREDGRTAMHLAAYQTKVATVKALVEKVPEGVRMRTAKGNTPLSTTLLCAQMSKHYQEKSRDCVELFLSCSTEKDLTVIVGEEADDPNVLHLAAACSPIVAMPVFNFLTDDSLLGLQCWGGRTVLHAAVSAADKAAKPLPFSDEKPQVDTTVIRALAGRMSPHDKSLRHEGRTAAELAQHLGRPEIAVLLSSTPKNAN